MLFLTAQTTHAFEPPNCIDRIKKLKQPNLPVNKDVLLSNDGCLFTVNWGTEKGSKKPDVYDIRHNDECEGISRRIQRVWRKMQIIPGKDIAHCKTTLSFTCPKPNKDCRFKFYVSEEDIYYHRAYPRQPKIEGYN